ncbi:MW1434 family type I TA system toxin [Peribacillus asahii]|uniref:Thoeris anti-defense Tad2 family protein n=1 Tax=Peribacillus asahii TaxID=228899 RepID=UPI0037FA089D
MNYKKGDKVEVTENFDALATPFMKHVFMKKDVAIILDLQGPSYYYIRSRGREFAVDISQFDSYTKLLETDSPKRYSRTIEKGLTYGQAMDKLMIHGKKVTRAVWGGYWEVQHVGNISGSPSWMGKFIVAVLKDGGYAMASPYQEDMFATDWMVVE